MLVDQPVIDYGSDRRSGRSMMASRREVQELDELQEAWNARRNGRSHVGDKFSLEGFLKEK